MIISSKTCVIFSFNFLLIFSLHFFPFLSTATQLAPALYVFGDSLFDSGNNNFLPTIAKANYFPYGTNFVHRSTGRFTNGKTVADFIAEFLGLPFPPPYLSKRHNLPITGLNYASGSCGILAQTGRTYGKCLNFEEQVGLFESTVKSLHHTHFKNSEELSNYLSKSIFIISTGSNDYISNFFSILNPTKRYTPQQFAQILVHKLSNQLQRLYKLGARKIVVFDIGALGCLPSIRRIHGHIGQCVEDRNHHVSLFNNMLSPLLQNLTSTLNGSSFVNGQFHSPGYDAITNPSKYGLVDSSKPCCTTVFNGTSGCIPLLRPCRNADKHFFWDGYHLTEAVYSVVASRCIKDSSVCNPFSLNELVKM